MNLRDAILSCDELSPEEREELADNLEDALRGLQISSYRLNTLRGVYSSQVDASSTLSPRNSK